VGSYQRHLQKLSGHFSDLKVQRVIVHMFLVKTLAIRLTACYLVYIYTCARHCTTPQYKTVECKFYMHESIKNINPVRTEYAQQ